MKAKEVEQICENCKWMYGEYCANSKSYYCAYPVSDDDSCNDWERKNDK